MRKVELSFRAQSLDNTTPDHMVENGRTLDAAQATEREELASRISRVSISGQQVSLEGSNSAFLLGNEFLLDTPSDQLDSAGRMAPIICYGSVPEEPWESWTDEVLRAQRGFAESIGRDISEESASSARRGLERIIRQSMDADETHRPWALDRADALLDHIPGNDHLRSMVGTNLTKALTIARKGQGLWLGAQGLRPRRSGRGPTSGQGRPTGPQEQPDTRQRHGECEGGSHVR